MITRCILVISFSFAFFPASLFRTFRRLSNLFKKKLIVPQHFIHFLFQFHFVPKCLAFEKFEKIFLNKIMKKFNLKKRSNQVWPIESVRVRRIFVHVWIVNCVNAIIAYRGVMCVYVWIGKSFNMRFRSLSPSHSPMRNYRTVPFPLATEPTGLMSSSDCTVHAKFPRMRWRWCSGRANEVVENRQPTQKH